MLLRIPLENLGEASSLGHLSQKQDVGVHLQTSERAPPGMLAQTQTSQTHSGLCSSWFRTCLMFLGSADVGTVGGEEGESLETLRFTVNIESLALVLYSNDPNQVSETFQRLLKAEHTHPTTNPAPTIPPPPPIQSSLCSSQPSEQQRSEKLRLAEFALHLLKTSGKLWTTGCVEVTTVLGTCTLDDLRAAMNRVTSR